MQRVMVIRLCIGALITGGIAAVHWTRNSWNAPVSSFDDVSGWTELTAKESIFHQMGAGNEHNRKFVSPDGHSEAIFRPNDSGEDPTLVNDPANYGTYNFFGPRFFYGITHGLFDVVPYFIFGNSPSDMFNLDRFTVLFK